MSDRVPAEVFSVADFINDELAARAYSIDWLEKRLTPRNVAALRAVMAGSGRMTASLADGIGDAFSTSATLWLNLDNQFFAARRKALQDDIHAAIARLVAFEVSALKGD